MCGRRSPLSKTCRTRDKHDSREKLKLKITNYQLSDSITIDREQRSVCRDGHTVHLTGLEYGLLDYLSAHANHICTRQELLDHIWGGRFRYDTGTIDVHLNALRRKLGWGTHEPIQTIRGVGFVFRVERQVACDAVDLQLFLTDWLRSRDLQLRSAGLTAQLQLTPFVNSVNIASDALQQWLDASLQTMLPTARTGVLRLTSRLTMQSFTLSLDINGTTSELRIPVAESLR